MHNLLHIHTYKYTQLTMNKRLTLLSKRILFGVFASSLLFSGINELSAQTNYDYNKIQREVLGRGVVAIRSSDSKVAVSWRYLQSDPENVAFNIYRNGTKINAKPLSETTFFEVNYSGNQQT